MKRCWIYAVIMLSSACVDPYVLRVRDSNANILVVDGFINSGSGPTTIRLTRSQNISETENALPELNAQVLVEGEDHTVSNLAGDNTGVYTIDQLSLTQQKYRIRIKTKDQLEYASDFVEVKQTPPIDAVVWKKDADELGIYVTSKDPSGKTLYYQWDYDETWHYRSAFCTSFEYKNGEIMRMDPVVDIHNCWRSEKSNISILIASSAKLTEDVIYQFPVKSVPLASDKLQLRYSILVKQNALTKEAFEYLDRLKKNTETLGSIFDPLPSQLTGNIHCTTDAGKLVIGFVSAYNVVEKRIFVDREDLGLSFYDGYAQCYAPLFDDDIYKDNPSLIIQVLTAYYQQGLVAPINPTGITPDSLLITNMPYALRACVDCRVFKGTNVRPDFWPTEMPVDPAPGCN